MSVAKVIEITASSEQSFDKAVQEGVERASRTVENIQSVWVKEMNAEVKNNKVTKYRVTMKITFLLSE